MLFRSACSEIFGHGFDEMKSWDYLSTFDVRQSDNAIDYIKKHAKDDKPFFMDVNFMKMHNPNNPAAAFRGNWFDDYRGYDLDRDGYGDVPHHPVRLFSLIIEQNEPALILLRSLFVSLLDRAEQFLPALTPATLADAHPRMHRAR